MRLPAALRDHTLKTTRLTAACPVDGKETSARQKFVDHRAVFARKSAYVERVIRVDLKKKIFESARLMENLLTSHVESFTGVKSISIRVPGKTRARFRRWDGRHHGGIHADQMETIPFNPDGPLHSGEDFGGPAQGTTAGK